MMRPRMLTLHLLIFLALSAFPDAAQSPPAGAGTPPSFTAADQLSAARDLRGAVGPGTAARQLGAGETETVSGFLDEEGTTLYEVLLSASFEAHGVPRHAFVLGGHFLEDGRIDDSHGQTTTLAAAVLEFRNRRWTPVARDPEITQEGQNGYAPGVSLRRIGEARHAIEVSSGFVGQGYAFSGISLFAAGGASFQKVLSVALQANDCGMDERNCFTYEGTLEADPTSGPETYDLRLTLKGTYRNEADKIVRIPAAPLVLRLKDGSYQPVLQTAAVRALWEAVTHPAE